MTAPEQQTTDPRQPAWDAVFAYIRTLSRDALPGSIVERNAVIWRAVNAALVALGYPDADTQQAAPEQADLRQRIATAASGHWMKLPNEDGYSVCGCGSIVRYDRHHAAFKLHVADTVLAVVEPELAALRAQLAAAQAENERLRAEQTTYGDLFETAGRVLATSPLDWGERSATAWLWGVINGWDCNRRTHDDTCVHGAMDELAAKHGWDAQTVAEIRRFHTAITYQPPARPST